MWEFIRNHAGHYGRLSALILSGFGVGFASTGQITGTKISADLDDMQFEFDDLLSTDLKKFSPQQSLALAGSISLLNREHPLAQELVRKSRHRENFFAHESVDIVVRKVGQSQLLSGQIAATCPSSVLNGMKVSIYGKEGEQQIRSGEVFVIGQPHGRCTAGGPVIVWVSPDTWNRLVIDPSASGAEVKATGLILSAA